MKCKDCGVEIFCNDHGADPVDEFEAPDEGHFYHCGACLDDYGAVLGGIVHWCSDLFGVLGGDEQTLYRGDGRVARQKMGVKTIPLEAFSDADERG